MRFRYRRLSKKQFWKLLASCLFTLTVLIASQASIRDQISGALQQNQPGLYRVTKFVDGDTVDINMNGRTETIRFIGVDTPETHDPRKPVQCYGREASNFTQQLIGNRSLRLAADPLDTDRDRYDRLLRYVYLPDGTLVNQTIIEQGYGFYYPYFPFTKKAEFAAAQTTAQASKRGLWSNCQPVVNDDGGYTSNALMTP